MHTRVTLCFAQLLEIILRGMCLQYNTILNSLNIVHNEPAPIKNNM